MDGTSHLSVQMDGAGRAGKSQKFAGHSPARVRVWPADDQQRPVSKGQQRERTRS
jgi:hypothetical protein